MKSGGVVESQKLINLVQFNWYMTSLLRHNDVITVITVITVRVLTKILLIKVKKFRDVSDLKTQQTTVQNEKKTSFLV